MFYILKSVKCKVKFAEAYSEPSRKSMIWFFVKIICLYPLTIFAKMLLHRCLTGYLAIFMS